MRTKLESLDTSLFAAIDETQSQSLAGGMIADDGGTGTASATYSGGKLDGTVDADWSW